MFPPEEAVRLDLDRGVVCFSGAQTRAVLLPITTLAELCAAAGAEAARDAGERVGRDIRAGLPPDRNLRNEAPKRFEEQVGHVLALYGLGRLSLERWGKALVFALRDRPGGPGLGPFVSGVFAGLIAGWTPGAFEVIALGEEAGLDRYWVAGQRGGTKVRALLASGRGFAEALARLQTSLPVREDP